MPDQAEPLLTPAATDEEIAAVQAAIGDVVDGWAAEVEAGADWSPPDGAARAGDYAEHQAFAEASDGQLQDLDDRLESELRR